MYGKLIMKEQDLREFTYYVFTLISLLIAFLGTLRHDYK